LIPELFNNAAFKYIYYIALDGGITMNEDWKGCARV
jgi:hypothetical protein